MKKKIRDIAGIMKEESGKQICSYYFIAAVLGVTLILMTRSFYTDPSSGEEYNMFKTLVMKNRAIFLRKNTIYFQNVALNTVDGYIYMFMPVLTAVPFVSFLCVGRKNSIQRFELYRTGKTAYVIGNALACILSGGLIFTLGNAVYILIAYGVLPKAPAGEVEFCVYLLTAQPWVSRLYQMSGITVLFLIRMVSGFLYGGTSVLAAFTLAAFLQNKYIILCIPFMANYMLMRLSEKIMMQKEVLLEKYMPQRFCSIITMNEEQLRKLGMYWLVVMILVILLYRVVMERKVDCSE